VQQAPKQPTITTTTTTFEKPLSRPLRVANMSKGTKFLLVSLPTSITPSHHADEALAALQATVTSDVGTTVPFAIPTFKIGTLDALVQQADDLAKLGSACEAVVNKVGDSLKNILEGEEDKIQQQKTINDKPVDQYLRNFQWNKVKYRDGRTIAELIDLLQKVSCSIPLPAV
jgi:V-type H+-transporting ATPase subunit C